MRRLRNSLIAFLIAVIGSGFAFAASLVRAESPRGLIQGNDEVAVTYNYDLARSRFSPYAYYTGKSDMAAIAGACKLYDANFTDQSKLFANPMVIETRNSGLTAEGATLSLGCFDGEFSLIANALQTTYFNGKSQNSSIYYDGSAITPPYNGKAAISSGNTALIDFKTVEFNFIDLNDEYNVLTLVQKQVLNSDSTSNIFTYKGKSVELRSWNSLQGVHYGVGMPILMGFNPVNKTFAMGQRKVVYSIVGNAQHGNDGSDFGFSDFDMSGQYEVTVTFRDLLDGEATDYWKGGSYERRGRLAVYSVAGQPLTGAENAIVSKTSPSVIVRADSGFVGMPYRLPKPEVYDLVNGYSVYDITPAVSCADGSVTVTDGAFTPAKEGKYTLSYNFTHQGAALSKNVEITAVKDTVPPQIELVGGYETAYLKGTKLKILDYIAEDNSLAVKKQSVTVYRDGNKTELSADGFITLDGGSYKVEYYAEDYGGLFTSLEKEFVVYDFSLPATDKIEIGLKEVFLPQPALNGDAAFRIDVFAPDDVNFERPLAENVEKFKFERLGKYVLRYTVTGLGENVYSNSVTKTFEVVDVTPVKFGFTSGYKKSYEKGEQIEILQPTVTDNAPNPTFEIKVLRGKKDVTKNVEDGVITLSGSGKYSVIYTASDLGGNSTVKVFEFTVSGGMPVWAIVLLSAGGVCAAGTATFFTVRFILKKRSETNE